MKLETLTKSLFHLPRLFVRFRIETADTCSETVSALSLLSPVARHWYLAFLSIVIRNLTGRSVSQSPFPKCWSISLDNAKRYERWHRRRAIESEIVSSLCIGDIVRNSSPIEGKRETKAPCSAKRFDVASQPTAPGGNAHRFFGSSRHRDIARLEIAGRKAEHGSNSFTRVSSRSFSRS